MDWSKLAQWFSGGAGHQYHPLTHCMQFDTPWIALTVGLDVAVAAGYVLIAYHWYKNQRLLPPSPARRALATMRNIFAFCGVCGYLFIPVKLVWPAWRLYDMFMVVLVFYTWRYALSAKNLRVIYSAIGRSEQLAGDLERSREESRRKSLFLNAISHDLRTPLNGLLLNANLAELHAGDGDRAAVQESIRDIKDAARLTADLLDGLLEFARVDADDAQPACEDVTLRSLLDNLAADHAAPAAAKGLSLSVSCDAGLSVCTDGLKLRRALNNLLDNAVRFTDTGTVRVEANAAGDGCEIHVIDTGVGIGAEHADRLFDEFFQVKNHERNRHNGLGLGLAISRRVARHLGGDLVVDTALGRGSRFTLVLPGAPRRRTQPGGRAGARPVRLPPSARSLEPAGAVGRG